ncbi:hypothetical protein ABEB36_005145 [Hypothenemus hampei]|uniref:Uncharacterized protein n=1 Tax=Hypothenemus hampei TaxID=57062 RepID=A0ABD1EXR2_HYPHA
MKLSVIGIRKIAKAAKKQLKKNQPIFNHCIRKNLKTGIETPNEMIALTYANLKEKITDCRIVTNDILVSYDCLKPSMIFMK